MNYLSWFATFIFVLGCVSRIQAGGCSVGVSYAPRAYTWVAEGLTYKTYDVNIFNNGSCDTTYIIFLSVSFDNPADQVSQFWNLFQEDPTHFAYLGPPSISASSATNVGFVVAYQAPSEGVVTVNLLSADCAPTGNECVNGGSVGEPPSCSDMDCTAYPYVCISDGGLPRCISESQSSSSSTTSGAAAASSSSTTTSSTSTSSSSQCLVAASITARDTPGSSWLTGDTPYQIYDILVTNAGTCDVLGAQLVFDVASGSSISSTWNLSPSYVLENFGTQMLPGASYNGAGLVVEGGGSISVSVGGTTCSC